MGSRALVADTVTAKAHALTITNPEDLADFWLQRTNYSKRNYDFVTSGGQPAKATRTRAKTAGAA